MPSLVLLESDWRSTAKAEDRVEGTTGSPSPRKSLNSLWSNGSSRAPKACVDFTDTDPTSPALRSSASEPALGPPTTPSGTATLSPSSRRVTGFERGAGPSDKTARSRLLDKVRNVARLKLGTGRVQPEEAWDNDSSPLKCASEPCVSSPTRRSFLSRFSSFGRTDASAERSSAAESPSNAQTSESSGEKRVKFRMSRVSARFVTPYAKVYGMHPRFFQYNRKGEMELTDAGIAEEMKGDLS